MPWIHHPATQDGPVSIMRWLKFHAGQWMQRIGYRWEDEALHPERRYCPDCGQKMYGDSCDHIPF